MTPHELNLHVQAFNERMKAEDREGITLAYLTAYWGRVKKLPELKKILKEDKPKREPTPERERTSRREQAPEQMLEKVKILNAVFGGTSG